MTLLPSIPVLVIWAGLLVRSDLRHRRLPDGLTVPPAVSALLVTCWFAPVFLVPGLAWSLIYLLLAGLTGGGIGGGDIKLAVPLGILATVIGGISGGLLAAALSGLLTSVVLVGTGRSSIPHGPAMFAGTLIVLVSAVPGSV
ncbi:prepilin peptidase [Corynebacterium sp. CCM 8835]|uniref:Prepilin peptidase n=1 Tax=Corynebacterium antarcticum TaxID=2800405 RepID=A0A9Q4CAZ0_9CORY|nr:MULTISPECIES: prepilin peptidase [Corynebacterium]MBV7293369.1 prepilin peptidase [Corynebacterium sp. TAE3-ERU16]MCK7641507.1 prepilin peptidase [Corynebacterium antarcticum]MCK7660395.1 prepilin peptidase [Corynebacterium antarcticum]MCL0244735.1 prepilin peptidase [Corynebacterium antarcticum]MCX7491108.1 prepilin peptidase [Corynebacterium antarcticum]